MKRSSVILLVSVSFAGVFLVSTGCGRISHRQDRLRKEYVRRLADMTQVYLALNLADVMSNMQNVLAEKGYGNVTAGDAPPQPKFIDAPYDGNTPGAGMAAYSRETLIPPGTSFVTLTLPQLLEIAWSYTNLTGVSFNPYTPSEMNVALPVLAEAIGKQAPQPLLPMSIHFKPLEP